MSILDFLDPRRRQPVAEPEASDAVHAISQSLEELPEEERRYVAAFAYLLGRVANADGVISEEEREGMAVIVERVGGLTETQADLALEIAHRQNELFGATENFLVAREFRTISNRDQRQRLLECLIEVAVADGTISNDEENEIGFIGAEIGFSRREVLDALTPYAKERELLKGFKS